MERLGIIDIGSNSIRVVVYELTNESAYRVIDEAKESARLSQRLDPFGKLSGEDLHYLAETLRRFVKLCELHRVTRLRAAATAAIRNSPERDSIISALTALTGVPIEIISGAEEARLGFVGMINTIDIQDGISVDIGGGSTEVLLFRNRSIVRSASFPFGAVNMMQRFGKSGDLDAPAAERIAKMVKEAAASEPWISEHPGLPLIGLGGTIRALCKIDQRERKYSLPITHAYQMTAEGMERWVHRLRGMPLQVRRRINGLSKSRADIIVPGLIILQSIFQIAGSTHMVVSGSGLRDGIFFEMLRPKAPIFSNVLEHSLMNLLALHPSVSLMHVMHIEQLALQLFRGLRSVHQLDERSGVYLRSAALVHRIGISVNFYNYHEHTYYLTANSRINGLTHREIVLCALIASFKNEKRVKPLFAKHRDLLTDDDYQLVIRLGSLLSLAAAFDRGAAGRIERVSAKPANQELHLSVTSRGPWEIEKQEVMSLAKDFSKIWGYRLLLSETSEDIS